MAGVHETYDVIICGAGSGGGFLAGEIAPHGSLLILDSGPYVTAAPVPGIGAPESRRFSTQINLGQFIPDEGDNLAGSSFFAYPNYMSRANPLSVTMQREARVVGGGSHINVGAWVRPRLVDWDDFAQETGVEGWTKAEFEPHFLRAEQILHVHRDPRHNWNKASVLYEQTATGMGIPVFETASNRHRCIFCGQRLNAGMPCKYDALMSTAVTQIPKALAAGARLEDEATVLEVEISDGRATGVVYRKHGEILQARARKLVVLSAGAIGTPLILFNSGVHHLNQNVGRYLRAHPGVPVDALLPGNDWNTERGYQWNCHHYVMDENGEPMDAIVHVSAGFPAATPWVAAAAGFFGKPYKNLMRKFQQRAGAFIFQLKPNMHGRVVGSVERPSILFPVVDETGFLEPKVLNDLRAGVRQVSEVYGRMGAITTLPSPSDPDPILNQTLTLFVTSIAAGALHPQSTCRAGADPKNSVVDTFGMLHDVRALMCCDASVIPHHISSNPNALIMALSSRAADYAIAEILGERSRREVTRKLEVKP
jgi:choline dehydrogenase-like flavoprotein